MLVGYISLGIAVISLCLGLYNWNQSLVRLRADTRLYTTLNGCWAIETTISNKSSRPITILKTYIARSKGQEIEEAEIRNARDFYVYMHDGHNVGTTKRYTSYPIQVSAYGACEVERVIVEKPTNDSKLVIITPSKTFKFNVSVPE